MLRVLALTVALCAPAATADVIKVPGPGLTTIQSAVDAARDGDTILVYDAATFVFEGFTIDGKGLSVIANSLVIELTSQIRIVNTAPDQPVLISRLRAEGTQLSAPGPLGTLGHGLYVENTLGPVRVSECTFEGARGWSAPTQDAYHAALVAGFNADVALVRSVLLGGQGAIMASGAGGRGGDGLRVENAMVQLSECTVTGGRGGYGEPDGGRGGDGLHAIIGTIVSSGSTYQGGMGAYGCDCCCFLQSSGDGGHGFRTSLSTQAFVQDDTFVAGLGAPSCSPGCGGAAGVDGLALTGSTIELPGTSRSFSMASPGREGQQLFTAIQGEPGDLVFLAISGLPGQVLLPQFGGALVMGVPWLSFELAAVLPGSGTLNGGAPMPFLPPGEEAVTLWVQAFMTNDLVTATLSSWTALVLLDESL